MHRRVPSAFVSCALLALLLGGLSLALPVRPALADRASAEAAMPGDSQTPFLRVSKTTTTAGAWDDLPRLPEYAVYPDGLFLVQKSDQLLWAGRLSRDQTVELMRFLLDEARVQGIDMRYLVTMPITTFTQYTLRTKLGTWSPRKRASGGYGPGVKEGERDLAAVDQRVYGMADLATQLYQPGSIFVVASPVAVDARIPEWTANDRMPFAALVGTTSVESGRGAILSGTDARSLIEALGRSTSWRFGTLAAEFRVRPALPEEGSVPRWGSPATATAPPPAPPPVVVAPPAPIPPAPLPVPPPMPPAPEPTPLPTEPLSPPPPPPAPTPLPTPSGPVAPGGLVVPPEAPIARPEAPTAPPEAPVAPPEAPPAPPAPATPAGPVAPSGMEPGASPADAASLEWRDDDLDYAGLQTLLTDMKRKATGSPHAAFWKLPYAEFIVLEFDLLAVTGKVRVLDKGSGTVTNLVRAFREQPLTIRLPNGSTREEKFSVMPPKGAPMPEADIVRIERWVAHGTPEFRPTAGGPTPESPTPPTPVPTPEAPTPVPPTPTVAVPTATGERSPLAIVGEGTLRLGSRPAATDDGSAPPRLYVARDAAGWTNIFDIALAKLSGSNGPTCAVMLKDIREAVKGYDFAAGPLLLLLGPATDNYTMKVGGALEMLSDGSARVPVTTSHEQRVYAVVPEILVVWSLHRIAGPVPPRFVLSTNGVLTGGPVGGS